MISLFCLHLIQTAGKLVPETELIFCWTKELKRISLKSGFKKFLLELRRNSEPSATGTAGRAVLISVCDAGASEDAQTDKIYSFFLQHLGA